MLSVTCGGAQDAPDNLARNPACEAVEANGLPAAWRATYSSGGTFQVAVDRKEKAEGAGSIRLVNAEGGAKFPRLLQTVTLEPHNRYRFSARLRSVQGRAIVSLSSGSWISQAMPGTRNVAIAADGQWQDVEIVVEAGSATNVNLLVALLTPNREAADVWIDDVRLTRANPDFSHIPAVSQAYETPHVAWARPHASGPIATLFIQDARVTRDAIELTQRLDLDATYFVPATDFKNIFDHHRLNDALDALQAARADGRPALVVLAGYSFTNLPAVLQQRILTLVDEGAGLALFPSGQDDAAAIGTLAEFHPVRGAQLFGASDDPMLRRLAEGPYGTVMAGARGKGNILSVVYRPYRAEDDWKEWPCRMSSVYPLLPPRVYHRNMFRFWEYLYSDLARRLLDAASVPAPVTVAEAAVNRGPGGIRLQLNLTHSAAARPARCRAAWIGPEYQTVTQRIVRTTLAPGSNRLDMPLEGLARTGPQAVHLWIETPDGKILAWAAVAFHQEGPKVARIAVARERYEPGESIEGRVAIDGVLDGLRCVIELQDTFGRVVARREQAASTNLAFALDSAGVLSRLACVTAELRRNGGVLHRAAVDVPVPRDLDATDYNVGIWASYVAQVERRHWAPEMIEQQRRLGVDFSLMAHGYSDDYYHSYVRRNMVPVPDNLHRIFFKLKDYYRQLNLADPAHRRKIAEEVAANARYGYRWGSFDYSIGDECGYDVKRDPLTFARFKAHLVARYETVDALNAQWSTRYASWDELRDFPRAEQDYDPAVSIAPQLEHRRFMDDLFIETIAGIRQQLKTLDPRNRTGISGTRDPGHYIGFDWWKLMNNMDHLTFYDGIQREAIRSFRKPGDFITSFIGYDFYSLSERNARWFPWFELFSGMQGVAIYAASSGDYHGFVNHDLTLPRKALWLLEDLRELKGGIGKAILTAERERAPIAMLYSHKSLHASPAVYKDTIVNIGEIIKDGGLQYDFLADEQLERGLLAKRHYRVLILPFCLSLSNAEATRIGTFVAEGGTLIVVGAAGIYNENGRVRESGALADLTGVELDTGDVRAGLAGRERQTLAWDDVRLDCLPAARQVRLRGGTAALGVYTHAVAALTRRQTGKGSVWWLNGRPAEYRRLVSSGVGGEFTERKSAAETDAAAARRLLAAMLTACRPAAQVLRADGSEKPYVEQVLYRNGAIAYLGLIERYFGGRYYRDPVQELIQADEHEPVTIKLPGTFHVYDMRGKRYLGLTDTVNARMTAAVAHLYALLPYAVASVAVHAGTAQPGGDLKIDIEVRAAAKGTVGNPVVRLEVFTPDGRPCEAYARNIVTQNGRAAVAIPLALNDPAGAWRIKATEVASGMSGEAEATLTPHRQSDILCVIRE